ncbi:dihydrodipicolinate synthase family protein [Halomarina salina]|uniref:Dihydrodipicolinate synthase family protein n=1 Tax=Halomarina salina TaxID=1872699 RepID=A0ABD5RNA4_9EURY|nr:dihydrodipicolinate synthase family protein [Halomarina salina]
MHGTGAPVVTPFDESGAVDEAALRETVEWQEARGIDFLVPCGSTSEAPLMTPDERARVTEVVCDAASGPVLAGTGHAGLAATKDQTERASKAGADGALVVTPFYFDHGPETMRRYYEAVADASPIPVYLYSVPVFTDVALDPDTVESLATHSNVHGMKDSSGDIGTFQRLRDRTPDDFDLFVGSGSVYAPALDAGADGSITSLANLVPEAASEVYETHAEYGAEARELSAALVELNVAVTETYGIPGLKAAMRDRGAPAGYPRSPFEDVDDETREQLTELVDDVLVLV